MTRRSPARFLAPLALLAVCVALFAVLSGGGPASEQEASPGGTPATTTTSQDEDAKDAKRRSRGRRTYTVKSGDTPSGIAEKTGVTVEKLLDLNPDLDPQSLVPGTKLKLR